MTANIVCLGTGSCRIRMELALEHNQRLVDYRRERIREVLG
jgi:hypothetical protein